MMIVSITFVSFQFFIKSLLVLDTSKRLTAAQALDHPWVRGTASKAPLQNLTENIKQFNAKRKLKVSHQTEKGSDK